MWSGTLRRGETVCGSSLLLCAVSPTVLHHAKNKWVYVTSGQSSPTIELPLPVNTQTRMKAKLTGVSFVSKRFQTLLLF